jgi:glycosyltransferase involved in cell wall biosynthesis
MPVVAVLVSNDLVHDQRVAKVCNSLNEMGFDIVLAGRLLKNSPPIQRPYKTIRFRLPFTTGPLFYASLQIRLFFFLCFVKADVFLANDLDTLLPARIVAKIRRKKLVYDSHEYFTEAEGLIHNNFAKNVWTLVEKFCFPAVDKAYTVNESIAEIYRQKYHIPVGVIRNIPPFSDKPQPIARDKIGVPNDAFLIILQGAFIDNDRGALATAKALEFLPEVYFLLIGAGPEWQKVKDLKSTWHWGDRIIVLPKMEYHALRQYTASCDLGISLDLDRCLNYRFSLPNKLFDYLHAGIPVLASNLPEIARIMKEYPFGLLTDNFQPEALAAKIQEALLSKERVNWMQSIELARTQLTWQNEANKLKEMYKAYLR